VDLVREVSSEQRLMVVCTANESSSQACHHENVTFHDDNWSDYSDATLGNEYRNLYLYLNMSYAFLLKVSMVSCVVAVIQ